MNIDELIDENDIEFKNFLKKHFNAIKNALKENKDFSFDDERDLDIKGMGIFLFEIIGTIFDFEKGEDDADFEAFFQIVVQLPFIMESTIAFNQWVASFIKSTGMPKEMTEKWHNELSEAVYNSLYEKE